jgi:hypothetical protein
MESQWKGAFYLSVDRRIMAVEIHLDAGNVRIGPPHPLFSLPPEYAKGDDGASPGFAVSPNGQRFLIAIPNGQNPTSSVKLIVNWRSAPHY